MSEVSVVAIPEMVATLNKSDATDQDETAKKELSLPDPEAGQDAVVTNETTASIVIKTEPIENETNNNEVDKPVQLEPDAIKIEPDDEKETDAPGQDTTPKRKVSDPAVVAAGVTNEASPSKRIKLEPNETESNNKEAVKPEEPEPGIIKMEPDDDIEGVTKKANETEQKNNDIGKPVKQEPDDPEVKTEPTDGIDAPSAVKTEPTDGIDPPSAVSVDISSSSTSDPVKVEPADSGTPPVAVKTEPTQSNGQGQQAAAGNGSAVVSSSTTRPSCRFGIRCYRRNPAHRSAEAHPFDDDYRRPDYPAPPLGTPACPFGNACYRRNPIHFQRQSHPPDFNSVQNVLRRLRQRTYQQDYNDPPSDALTDEEEDPFAGDSDRDADYNPGDEIDNENDEDEEELEFDSQRVNCDQYD